ncbi:MAG: arsenate reductase family protein [Evtepia sp.]|uniref:arsenate reductase family protein n=1 Tax=Evtepia sp. TaxID=2773933 RepID=UPI002A763813|nr:arsenate reductase family protein [Evtepia sp.]MDY3014115.1 arsenate reductase family protein [Evtepia sp.]
MLVLCYSRCSTCKKALKWLDDHQIPYTLRDIKEENPTLEELQSWYKNSGLPLKKFFNTSGQLYRSMELSKKLKDMPEEAQLALLASDGMLVKRPLVVTENEILVGFKEEQWQAAFSPNKEA